MSGPPPAPPTVEPTKFNKGVSTDALTQKFAVTIPATAKFADDVRKLLAGQSFMTSTDVFLLPPDNYALSKADEAATDWKKLQNATGNVIGILVTKTVTPGQTETSVNLPTLPSNPQFWNTDIGGGGGRVQLPDTPAAQASLSGASINAADLLLDDWIYLVRANNLLKGIVMGSGSMDQDEGPRTGSFPAIQPPSTLGWSVDDRMGVEIKTSYTERGTKYLRSGWTQVAAEVTTPYAAASVEASHMETSARESSEKMTYITGTYNYPRCTIEFNKKTTKLSDEFLAELDSALDRSTEQEQKDALKELFDTYGHVFARRVTLGGLLLTTKSEITKSDSDRKKVEDSVKVGLKAVAEGMGGAGVSVGVGKSTDESSWNNSGSSALTYDAVGGDTLSGTTISNWIPTVGPYKNWRIIKTDSILPLTDLLDASDPRKARVLKLAPTFKPLRGQWVDVVEMFNDSGSKAKQGLHVYRPLIPTNQKQPWYWLGQTIDARKALVVQELIPGSLCPVKETQRVWDLKDTKGIPRDYYLGNPTPVNNADYVMMGSFFYNIPIQGNPPPPLDQNLYPQLRAIHGRHVTKGRFGDTPLWSDQGSGGKKQGSVWQIYRADDATGIPSVSMAQFYAIAGYSKPPNTVYCIKADAIEIKEFGK